MTFLDLRLPSPAANLACDEVLLDLCEAGRAGPLLRVWEPDTWFVVVGYGNCPATEVNLPACEAERVPVFRRCSGGGTVLQGPGCLNYSLVMRIEESGPLSTVTGTNQVIMERHREMVQRVTGRQVGVSGITDLTIDGQKFSGNAHRRRKRSLLFHGTFLLDFDIARVAKLLRKPSKEPDYRQGRDHTDFLMNLEMGPSELKFALERTWGAARKNLRIPPEALHGLEKKIEIGVKP